MNPHGFGLIRLSFRMAGLIAPTLAGRAAFALFARTGDANRISEKERRRLAQASARMAQAECHFLPTRQGISVAAHEFAPTALGERELERPRWALVLHGWQSRSEYMLGPVAALQDKGFRVIALDFPGHGQSAGRRLTMVDAVAAVEAAAFRFGPFDVIVGHSFGGAVAVNAVVGSIPGIRPVWTRRLVLIAAPSSMLRVFRQFGRFVGLNRQAQAAMEDNVERVAGRPLSDFSGARQLAQETLPVLVVHAPDDKDVPFSEAEDLAAAGRHVRLVAVAGLGHRRILSDQGVLEQIVEFSAPQAQFVATGENLAELQVRENLFP